MTKSEHIREQYARGVSRGELCEQYGASLVSHALTHIPKRPAGRPRKLSRCEHCGQAIPDVATSSQKWRDERNYPTPKRRVQTIKPK